MAPTITDLTLTTKRVLELEIALIEIEGAPIPPTPKGRYALAKASDKVVAVAERFRKEQKKLLEEHARKDEKGKPIKTKLGNERVKYDLVDEDAYTEAESTLFDEEVKLTGIRPVTHEELGSCPLSVRAMRLLLGVLIVDEEPGSAKP
jgi:hypothetical protein